MTKILLIDDSGLQRNMAKRALNDQGYEFFEGSNGLEGLSLMEEHQPDLVLCDLNMPVMGGLECIETMKSRNMDFPFIIMTADIQDTTKQKCEELGAKSVVHKPFKEEELQKIVKEVLAA